MNNKPLHIPLPFDQTIEAVLKVKPEPKKPIKRPVGELAKTKPRSKASDGALPGRISIVRDGPPLDRDKIGRRRVLFDQSSEPAIDRIRFCEVVVDLAKTGRKDVRPI